MMNFDYNTSRSHLILPEYGRNIHKMVEHVVSLTDREERNRASRTLISVMGNLNPHLRDIADFKHKLWDHLAIISNFKLDIDWPYPLPTVEILNEPPKVVPYNQNKIKYKHYGKVLEQMIKKAADMEDGPEKKYLTESLANTLKRSYLTWNREAVTDEVVYNDLKTLSGDKLVIEQDLKLSETKDILRNKHYKTHQQQNSGRRVIRKGKI